MDWSDVLDDGEELLWQGRPAPRCYTFRNWQHSVFGAVILVMSVLWFIYGLQLGTDEGRGGVGWIPVPFLFLGIYLSVGHLLMSRLEWEHVFYAMTDRRLVAARGLFQQRIETIDSSAVVWFQLRPLGESLGTVRVRGRDMESKITFSCLEYPCKLTDRLERLLQNNGVELSTREGP